MRVRPRGSDPWSDLWSDPDYRLPRRACSLSIADMYARARLKPGTGSRNSSKRLQVSAQGLFPLDRFEEGLEVPVPEAARAVALDHLEEQRRPVLRGLREDLEQVPVVVAVGQDAEPLEIRVVLVDLADAIGDVVVVRVRCPEEDDAATLQRLDGLHDVRRGQRHVLDARSVVELEVLLDLALALPLGR